MKIFNFEKILQRPTSLSEVAPIEEEGNQTIKEKSQIKDIVDKPLLLACEEMWDKNIKTISSSANKKDIEKGEASIVIDFESLSEENKQIARQYGNPVDYDNIKAIEIIIPISEETTVEELSQKAFEIAHSFKKQSFTWAPTYTIDVLKETYCIGAEETQYDDPDTWIKEGYYYNAESETFYISEEHYKKTTK